MHLSEIEDFFKEYLQAYLTFDSNSLIKFFYFPCLIHDLSGVHLLKNEQDLKTYEYNFLENLKQCQVVKIESEFLEHDLSKNLPNAVGCKLAYRVLDIHNTTIMDFDYTYSLIKNEHWKILFARLGTIRKS